MSAPGMLPALRVLLGATDDAACLLAELGAGAAPEHLRYKPGRSVVGRLSGGGGRWIAGFSPAAADKAQNLRARAAAWGIQLAERPVPGAPGHVLMSGPAGLDGRLRRPLSAERLVDAAGRPVGRVLNYNPWRRLVQAVGDGAVPRCGDAPHPSGQGGAAAPDARGPQDGPDGTPCGTWVAKTASTGQGATEARLRQLAAAGVPVLVPRGGADRRTLYYPFYGSGDLAGTVPEPESLGEAAGILARLHAHAAHHGPDRTVDPLRRLDPVVAAIGRLVPRLAPEVRRTADSLLAAAGTGTARTPVLLHGDFSADQLLAGPAGLRLIDLDRITHGPAEWDLGSFAAAELAAGRGPEHAEALLAAYRSALPGTSRDASEVRPWTGIHLLLRALEPFRAADPHWEDAIAARIRLAAAAGLR